MLERGYIRERGMRMLEMGKCWTRGILERGGY